MGVKRIDPERAKELLDSNQGFTFVDVRTEEEFREGHVPGAANCPFMVRGPQGAGIHVSDAFLTDMEGQFAREAKIILGCQKGGRSNKASQLLAEQGYTNVHDMRGGFIGETDPFGNVTFPGWATRGFPVDRK